MSDVIERLFRFVAERVPNVIAQILFAVLCFAPGPYRSVLLLVRFARQNKIPSPLFAVLSFAAFMVVVGFAAPFANETAFAMTETLAQLSNAEKGDLLFVTIYALGLTSLLGFAQLCFAALAPHRHRDIVRDCYYVAMALTLPWSAAIFCISLVLLLALPNVWALYHLTFCIGVAALVCAVPMLVFGLQMDRRWYRASGGRRRAMRIGSIYASALAILVLTPSFLIHLAAAVYADQAGLKFKIHCFKDNRDLYAAVTVDNPTSESQFLDGFEMEVEFFPGTYRTTVSGLALFQELKDDVVLRPKDSRRVRLMLSSRDPAVVFGNVPGKESCNIAKELPKNESAKPLPADARILH
jgi:hypothetical protein